MNLYFLYTRLPGYFYACIQALLSKRPEIRAFCVVYRPSSEAPYDHLNGDRLEIIYKDDFTRKELFQRLQNIPPDLMYVAGWVDKEYVAVAQSFRTRIPVIVGMDNPWHGGVRQRLASIAARAFLGKSFGYIWVPGLRQYEFARRLGFQHHQILTGLYCADETKIRPKSKSFINSSKTVLFVGRLVQYKHPDWIVRAFTDLFKEGRFKDWSVVLIGSGSLYDELKTANELHPQIKVLNFLQPSEIAEHYYQASIFCFPSSHEHWGVVVHEAAAAGLPLLLSDSCASADEFLIHGYNGLLFKTDDYNSFRISLLELLSKSEIELADMGAGSLMLSKRISHESWCATILSVLNRQI